MDNYWLLYNPASMRFYAYGGNGLRYGGASKAYVDAGVAYITALEQENLRLKELLKLAKVSDLGSYDLEKLAILIKG